MGSLGQFRQRSFFEDDYQTSKQEVKTSHFLQLATLPLSLSLVITKYQSTERLYCIQLWVTTEIKNIEKMYKNC